MTSMELLENLVVVKDNFVLEAHREDIPDAAIIQLSNNRSGRRIPMKRSLLIAAIIALMLMLVGCAIALTKLYELKIGEYSYTKPDPQNPSVMETVTSEFVSLQGLAGSPEYQAAKEWQDYLDSYDRDGAIIDAIGNSPTNLDSKYNQYRVYTQEMCDKLDEIAGKYGLKLHSEINIVDRVELDYQVGGAFMGNGLSRGLAYIYEDGTFQFDGDAVIDNTTVSFQLRRSVKGSLDEPVLNIGHVEDYEEYQHVTVCGEPVMLELGSDHALIFADFEECFIAINVIAGRENGIGEEDLKMIADAIDFVVLKNVMEPGCESRLSAYRAVLEDIYYNQRFPGGRDLGYDGFDMSINKFAVYDIDNDGSEELLVAYISTYMAGMAELIYDYDSATGTVWEEFIEFPFVSYYDNGVIAAGWSHNQGLAGENFWPYTLYQYNSETDTYDQVGMVDAWDKSLSDTNFEGDVFPDQIDLNGDGLVYYIMTEGEYKLNAPVDLEEYERWQDSYVNGAEMIDVLYKELVEENISNLK